MLTHANDHRSLCPARDRLRLQVKEVEAMMESALQAEAEYRALTA